MTKCKNCGKALKNPKAKYCSDKCRMAYNRKPEQSGANNPNKDNPNRTAKLSAQDLYDGIDTYPEDTWKDSEEYKELERRIKAKSVKTLEEEGYWIPNWKVKGDNKPK